MTSRPGLVIDPAIANLLKSPPLVSPTRRIPSVNSAKWMHERIVRSIVEFEEKLDDSHEIGARLVNFSEKEPIHIADVGYWGPDLIIFYGKNLEGHPVQLLQHVMQMNVLLIALPKEHDKPRRIGFELEQKLDHPSPAEDTA